MSKLTEQFLTPEKAAIVDAVLARVQSAREERRARRGNPFAQHEHRMLQQAIRRRNARAANAEASTKETLQN